MANIHFIDNKMLESNNIPDSLKDRITVLDDGYEISFSDMIIMKFGYICDFSGMETPFYIQNYTENSYKPIYVNQYNCIYECQSESYSKYNEDEKQYQTESLDLQISKVKLPRNIDFTFDFVTGSVD